jgi:hypothetical protein
MSTQSEAPRSEVPTAAAPAQTWTQVLEEGLRALREREEGRAEGLAPASIAMGASAAPLPAVAAGFDCAPSVTAERSTFDVNLSATSAPPSPPLGVTAWPPAAMPTDAAPALPFDVEHALEIVGRATSEDEAIAAAEEFAEAFKAAVPPGADPRSFVEASFGAEFMAVFTQVATEAVAALEAEATAGPVTEQAAARVARRMVRQFVKRVQWMPPRALRVSLAPRVRTPRVRRARREHRRVVRLSAVASAGHGADPPPPRRSGPWRSVRKHGGAATGRHAPKGLLQATISVEVRP